MAISKEDFIKEIENMSVLELNDLVEAIKERFDVSAAPVAVAAIAGDGETANEKSSFDVVLKEIGSNKIGVIKEVKAILELGLKEAKAVVEKVGEAVKKDVKKEEAEEIKTKLEAAGAVIELK